MLYLKNVILTLCVFLVASYCGVTGYAISSRDSKQPSQLTPSLRGPSATGNLKEGIETKTEHSTTTHHVPLDTASSQAKTHLLAKREVNQPSSSDETRVNGLYDPDLMIMTKRSAAALNKLILALRPYDASGSYESEPDSSNKDSLRYLKAGSRMSGASGASSETFPPYSLVRRGHGQKDRKIYLRCYFNAVSCF